LRCSIKQSGLKLEVAARPKKVSSGPIIPIRVPFELDFPVHSSVAVNAPDGIVRLTDLVRSSSGLSFQAPALFILTWLSPSNA